MGKRNFIRTALSAWMLAVFTFSVTPKILLHNLIADHRDTPIKSNYSHQEQFSKTGFNCDWDNLVVESPFLNDFPIVFVFVKRVFMPLPNAYQVKFHSEKYFHFGLRGPPVNSFA